MNTNQFIYNEPAFFTGIVDSVAKVTDNVFSVKIILPLIKGNLSKPQSGQFYMLRAIPSGNLLTRPISVYREFPVKKENSLGVEFLILLKGQGTSEICSLSKGSLVDVIGPQGNCFPKPVDTDKILIIGGGIGIAPVAGFAQTLPPKTYDLIASFKTGSYGLDGIDAKNLTITTDDGSIGIKGMLPTVLTKDFLQEHGYTVIYACGPEPMLHYIQGVAKEANIRAYLSMEARMACGMGACLGCTITTTDGNRRCCKDGPVFLGEKLIFADPKPRNTRKPIENPDLSVTIAGVTFNNPVIAASGTFGYGTEYSPLFDVNKLGGICSKGLTLEKRSGNTGIRLIETPAGLINSIGLENPGIPHFIEKELPIMLSYQCKTIANLSGSSLETYVEGAKLLENTQVPMIELNISCPNVKAGGMAFGLDPQAAAEVTGAVRKVTTKPLIVKLSPNAANIVEIAHAVRKAGADAISLVNTFQAMAINIETGKPFFDNIKAGLAGPAIRPIALRMVYDLYASMKQLPQEEQIPIIGLGGIRTWQDAVEFIMAGASAIQVGTATFAQPSAMIEIIEGLKTFMQKKGYTSIQDFCGIAHN